MNENTASTILETTAALEPIPAEIGTLLFISNNKFGSFKFVVNSFIRLVIDSISIGASFNAPVYTLDLIYGFSFSETLVSTFVSKKGIAIALVPYTTACSPINIIFPCALRSEERRVGKECR